jgi:CubicO group peptidase (beta-lactamase class C family)
VDDCRAEITKMMRAAAVPGLSIAVTRPDRVVYADAFGCGDLAACRPATPDTAYLWFSMSKLVTATAALRLADEGMLDLDAPAVQFGDHLRLACPVQPTTRQFLTHTAGLANPLPIRWVHAADAPAPDPQVLLRRLLRRRRAMRYPVGGAAHYSNVGYLVAAEVIAAAAGTPFVDYVQRAVLGLQVCARPATHCTSGRRRRPATSAFRRAPARCCVACCPAASWANDTVASSPCDLSSSTGRATAGLSGESSTPPFS